jgi:tetratricopeptide (TPR) repeat protein
MKLDRLGDMSKRNTNKNMQTPTPVATPVNQPTVTTPPANPNPTSEVDRYIKLQQAAERQIDRAWTAYKILGFLLAVVVATIGFIGYKSLGDYKSDLQNTFKKTTETELDRMKQNVTQVLTTEIQGLRTALGKRTDEEVSNMKASVNLRVDEEFRKDQIQHTVENVAGAEAKKAITTLIQPEADRFRKELDAHLTTLQEKAKTEIKEIAEIRERVEKQASTIQSIAGDSVEAKRSIESLHQAIQEAEKTLVNLKEVTGGISVLPDGRLVLGGVLTGRAWILLTNINRLIDLNNTGKVNDAYDLATDSIRRYEESIELQKQVATAIGDVYVNPQAAAQMYTMGAHNAAKLGKFDEAVKLSRKGVNLDPTPEAKAVLIGALQGVGSNEEAKKLLEEALSKNDDSAAKIKELLNVK